MAKQKTQKSSKSSKETKETSVKSKPDSSRKPVAGKTSNEDYLRDGTLQKARGE